MNEFLYVAELFDLYGALLTKKQRECLALRIAYDFSLAEIGENLGISRQAVHDSISRAEELLFEYEKKLGLWRRLKHEHAIIADAVGMIDRSGETNCETCARVKQKLLPLTDGEFESEAEGHDYDI